MGFRYSRRFFEDFRIYKIGREGLEEFVEGSGRS